VFRRRVRDLDHEVIFQDASSEVKRSRWEEYRWKREFFSFWLVRFTERPDFPYLMKAVVTVMPKPAILDPAGVATGRAMEHLGLKGVRSVRIGKSIEIEVDGADEKQLHEIAHDLLSNPVVEDYKLEILS
jgi:phosphoribosylformylglycinamidine synthase